MSLLVFSQTCFTPEAGAHHCVAADGGPISSSDGRGCDGQKVGSEKRKFAGNFSCFMFHLFHLFHLFICFMPILLRCDVFFVAREAPFGFPLVKLGLSPSKSIDGTTWAPHLSGTLGVEKWLITLCGKDHYLGMDQYLLIPFLGGWASIYQLFWCSPGVQGFDTLPSIIKDLAISKIFQYQFQRFTFGRRITAHKKWLMFLANETNFGRERNAGPKLRLYWLPAVCLAPWTWSVRPVGARVEWLLSRGEKWWCFIHVLYILYHPKIAFEMFNWQKNDYGCMTTITDEHTRMAIKLHQSGDSNRLVRKPDLTQTEATGHIK